MTGKFPFRNDGNTNEEIFRKVLTQPVKFPAHMKNQKVRKLVKALLNREPVQRPGAGPRGYAELRGDEFFEGFNWDALLGRDLKAPFIPAGENYAEAAPEEPMCDSAPVAEDDNLPEEDDGWVDPDPSWSDEF